MKNYVILILTIFICSCRNEQPFVGTYIGASSLTFRTIKLNSDSTYDLQTEGHAGDFDIRGKFNIKKDTIILIAQTPEINGLMKYILVGDSCLISIDNLINEEGIYYGYDLCKDRDENWTSRKWDLIERNIISDD